MSHDLTSHQWELLAGVLQHGGVLAAPFGHLGVDSLLAGVLSDIDALEERGLIAVERSGEHDEPARLTLTEAGYAALGMA